MADKKKRNPADLTLRNLKALRKDLGRLRATVSMLEDQIGLMAKWSLQIDKELKRKRNPHPLHPRVNG